MFIMGPSVDCPCGPSLRGTASEVSKWHPLRCCLREEEKGREGAAAQPPGLLCVGRLPLPVSAVSAAAAEWVSTRRNAHHCCCCPMGLGRALPVPLPPSAQRGVSSQPLPRLIAATVVTEEMQDWTIELGERRASG